MNTLLLRLSGTMQSWGVQSRFGVRDTGLEPSKSGVLGLICAAMGIDRANDNNLANLARLRMGVRVDREGRLKVDYHTAQNVLKAGGGMKDTELSNRYYLADAMFLVGLESDDLTLLESIHTAMHHPVWPLYLGRKAFVPGEPVCLKDGLMFRQDLFNSLKTYPYLGRAGKPDRLRIVLEDNEGEIVCLDQPLSFYSRRFAPRRLKTDFIPTPESIVEATACTSPA